MAVREFLDARFSEASKVGVSFTEQYCRVNFVSTHENTRFYLTRDRLLIGQHNWEMWKFVECLCKDSPKNVRFSVENGL